MAVKDSVISLKPCLVSGWLPSKNTSNSKDLLWKPLKQAIYYRRFRDVKSVLRTHRVNATAATITSSRHKSKITSLVFPTTLHLSLPTYYTLSKTSLHFIKLQPHPLTTPTTPASVISNQNVIFFFLIFFIISLKQLQVQLINTPCFLKFIEILYA